jgi:cyclic beta-1,2-glucan synthetase
LLGIIFLIFSKNNIFRIIGILFLIAPSVSYKISQKNIEKNTLKNDDVKKLEKIAYHTWNFFESNLNEKNNFLICDNYQEDRIPKTVNRTSSTNIGLEIISIISAYDMNFIDFDKCKFYLEALLNTIKRLSKWNGHLYNWYNTLSLEPLKPMYVSTVDSGNFVGYMYILKAFLEEHIDDNECNLMHDYIVKLIEDTDFSKLYSDSIKLLSVGFNLEDNKLTDSYYDFLASEARQASLVAIAKRDIPLKHWNALSRTITIYI